MEILFDQFEGEWRWLHPVVSATFLYVELLRIRPFIAENEALAWLLVSFHLIANGYQCPVMETGELSSLKKAVEFSFRRGDCQEAVALFNTASLRALTEFQRLLGGS